VVVSLADKLRIAAALDGLGADEAEVGSAAMGPEELAGLRVIADQVSRCVSPCWCSALDEDIYDAVRAGFGT
jgi:isopropylmalate/homocitrate/citramalate synthase